MIVAGDVEIPNAEGLAYRTGKQPPGSGSGPAGAGTGRPGAAEDSAIRSPDEGTGSVPP